MRMLVATVLTQGARGGDYHWCVEGEPVWVQEPCAADRRDPDGPCGCGRGFAGLHSHRGTTTARVIENAGFTRDDLVLALEASLGDGGWPVEWAADVADEMLELASLWPAGTVIERRVDRYRARGV